MGDVFKVYYQLLFVKVVWLCRYRLKHQRWWLVDWLLLAYRLLALLDWFRRWLFLYRFWLAYLVLRRLFLLLWFLILWLFVSVLFHSKRRENQPLKTQVFYRRNIVLFWFWVVKNVPRGFLVLELHSVLFSFLLLLDRLSWSLYFWLFFR